MRTFTFLLLIAVALLLEQTVLNFLRVAGVKPDLVLLLIVFNGMLKGSREGGYWGFVAGLVQDLAGGYYIGLNALNKLLAGYAAGLVEVRVYKESLLVAAVVVWGASMVSGSATFLLLLVLGVAVTPLDAFLRVVFPLAVYNSLLSLLFYRPFHRATFYGILREERY